MGSYGSYGLLCKGVSLGKGGCLLLLGLFVLQCVQQLASGLLPYKRRCACAGCTPDRLQSRSWKFPLSDNSAGRQHSLLSPLDCLSAKAGGAVNGGAYAPFILTVDWLGWLCYCLAVNVNGYDRSNHFRDPKRIPDANRSEKPAE